MFHNPWMRTVFNALNSSPFSPFSGLTISGFSIFVQSASCLGAPVTSFVIMIVVLLPCSCLTNSAVFRPQYFTVMGHDTRFHLRGWDQQEASFSKGGSQKLLCYIGIYLQGHVRQRAIKLPLLLGKGAAPWCLLLSKSGVMVKAMDCRIVVSGFVFQSCYYVHFRANTLGKDMNPLILPAMG